MLLRRFLPLLLLLAVLPLLAAAPATQPATRPSSRPDDDQSTPTAALRMMIKAIAAGDSTALRQVLVAGDADSQHVVDAFIVLMPVQRRLADVGAEKFGERARVLVLNEGTLKGVRVEVDGGTAVITESGGVKVPLRRDNGKWRVLFADMFANSRLTLKQVARAMRRQSVEYEKMSDAVEADHYPTFVHFSNEYILVTEMSKDPEMMKK